MPPKDIDQLRAPTGESVEQNLNNPPTESRPRPTTPKRINVAVNPETIDALQRVIEREGVTLTEAVRRLIGYGEVLYKAAKEDGAELLLKTDQETKKVIIL